MLCWLILCVNLIALRDAQIAGKTLFWVWLGQCFQERLAFELEEQVEIYLHQCGKTSFNLLKAHLSRTRRQVFGLQDWHQQLPHSSLVFGSLVEVSNAPENGFYISKAPITRGYIISSSGSEAFGSEWIMPAAFLVFQFADSILWDFLVFIIMWANSHTSPPVYLGIYCGFCFSGEPQYRCKITPCWEPLV